MGFASSHIVLNILFPDIPDFVKIAWWLWTDHRIKIFWIEGPSRDDIFPVLDGLADDELDARMLYFTNLLALVFVSYLSVGLVLTAIYLALQPAKRVYALMRHEPETMDRFFIKVMKTKTFMLCIVAVHGGLFSALLFYCYWHGSISSSIGVAWEFWIIWLHVGLGFGLLELAISFVEKRALSLATYPKAMTTGHLPIISEKVDVTKDLVFIAVAFHESDPFIGAFAGALLFGCQCYFIWDSSTRGELLESYLPVLSKVVQPAENPEVVEDLSFCARLQRTFTNQALPQVLLKQTSPARWRIAAAEDAPQGAAMLVFAERHGTGSLFVLTSIGISALRLAVASPCVAGIIHRELLKTVLDERHNAVLSGNSAKVLSLTRIVWQVRNDDDPAPELKQVGFEPADLHAEGITCKQMQVAGYTAAELKAASSTALELKTAGYTLAELKEAGYSVADVKFTDFKLAELRAAGYTAAELRIAGYTHAELKAAGYTSAGLKAAGYTAAELKTAGYTAAELKEAIYTAAELKTAGYTATELKASGYTVARLKAGYTAADFKAAGSTAAELKTAGYTLVELKAASYRVADVRAAGYKLAELKAAGYTAADMKTAGYAAAELKAAVFTVADLKAAGYTAAELKKAGYKAASLKSAGYTLTELKAAGCKTAEMTAGGTDCPSSPEGGLDFLKSLGADLATPTEDLCRLDDEDDSDYSD